jgi:protein required for attachment to host cells
MDATWIVSANASRARFFSQTSSSEPLQEIEDMVNAGARLRTSETESDKLSPVASGRSSQHNGAAIGPGSAYEPQQTPVEHQTELFARNVATFLLQGQQQGRFRHLCLVASPEFLGVLRKLLDPKLASAASVEINKDYTHFSGEQLREQIKAHQAKT